MPVISDMLHFAFCELFLFYLIKLLFAVFILIWTTCIAKDQNVRRLKKLTGF